MSCTAVIDCGEHGEDDKVTFVLAIITKENKRTPTTWDYYLLVR